MKRLVMLSVLLLLLVFSAMPAAAQDRLPAPELEILFAVNRAREGPDKGWDVRIQWTTTIPGDVHYDSVVLIVDGEGRTPKYVNETLRGGAVKWKHTAVNCGPCYGYWFRNLDEHQTIRIRVRALDRRNKRYGEKSATFKLRLPGFDEAAVVPKKKPRRG